MLKTNVEKIAKTIITIIVSILFISCEDTKEYNYEINFDMRLNKDNGYANFWYAAYLGEIGLLESRKQAIKNSYKVKKYAIRSIELEPDFDLPYHMMGRWHYELADLSNLEKKLASLVYGELPKGSYNEAVTFFQNAK